MISAMRVTADNFCFVSGGVRLAGVVDRPGNTEPTGSILLLSGSGPQDRDESIAGQRPFAVLSSALVRMGWQVLRWDDRGVGASGGDYLAASATQLVDDVGQAMTALEARWGISRHVLVGHSQGSLIAAASAARFPERVAGIALLAGMGLPGSRVLLDQHAAICRAEDWSDDDIEYSLGVKQAAFDVLAAAQADIAAGACVASRLQRLRNELEALFLSGAHRDSLSTEQCDALDIAVEDLLEWEWRYLVTVDPAETLSRVACPVLAVTGDRDSQVAAEPNLAAIASACERGGSRAIETHCVRGHNHLFQQAASARPSDYGVLGKPFAEPVPSLLADWLRRLPGVTG